MGLHFLERVIISLNEKARGNNIVIPYRESLMTMVLRDSLGGNCRTVMIANIWGEEAFMEETISTLKFGIHSLTPEQKSVTHMEVMEFWTPQKQTNRRDFDDCCAWLCFSIHHHLCQKRANH